MTPPFAVTHVYAHLPFLLIAVSLVYSATRHDRWDRLLKEAGWWVLRMGLFLGGLAAVLAVLSTWPQFWPYAAGVGGVGFSIYYWFTSPFLRKLVRPKGAVAAPVAAPGTAPK